MIQPVISVVLFIGSLILGIILIGGLLGFSRWLTSRAASGAVFSVHALIWFIATASRRLSLALQRAATWVALLVWRCLVALVSGAARKLREAMTGMQRPQDGKQGFRWRNDPHMDSGFAAGAGGCEDKAQPEAPDEYRQALDLLGLADVKPLTNAILKQRYRELIALFHPDRGCPTQSFAQQINAAVNVVKRAHGWR